MKFKDLKIGDKFKFAKELGVNSWAEYELVIHYWVRKLKAGIDKFINYFPIDQSWDDYTIILSGQKDIKPFKDLPIGALAKFVGFPNQFVKGHGGYIIFHDFSIMFTHGDDPCEVLGTAQITKVN